VRIINKLEWLSAECRVISMTVWLNDCWVIGWFEHLYLLFNLYTTIFKDILPFKLYKRFNLFSIYLIVTSYLKYIDRYRCSNHPITQQSLSQTVIDITRHSALVISFQCDHYNTRLLNRRIERVIECVSRDHD